MKKKLSFVIIILILLIGILYYISLPDYFEGSKTYKRRNLPQY